MPPAVSCWNCGHTGEQIHFCNSCHSLQPPTTDYFEFFGLPRKLGIDLAEMERRFYTLSRRLHPDVYFRRSAREQQFSLDATAILNDAYRTLRDPVSRAEYLLRGEGVTIAENVPPELIEEVFRFNMALEEADAAAAREIRAAFEGLLGETARELQSAAAAYDADGPPALPRLAAVLGKRRFLIRLLAQAESRT